MEQEDGECASNIEALRLSQLAVLIKEEENIHMAADQVALRKHGFSGESTLWREKVSLWCYDVIDHLKESRSIVYIAMNILDRFILLHSHFIANRSYEAAALTSLFLAVSISGSHHLEVQDLVRMSRLGVTIREIIDMGKEMTFGLSFDRRILTPPDFLNPIFSCFLNSSPSKNIPFDIEETALFYTELCIIDCFFSRVKPSDIALASILAATDWDPEIAVASVKSRTNVCFNVDLHKLLSKRIKVLLKRSISPHVPHFIPDCEPMHDDTSSSVSNEVDKEGNVIHP
jgi:Cyclin, N-terminal domain